MNEDFLDLLPNRVTHAIEGLAIPFVGREDLVLNKRASGRPKDLADLDVLEKNPP